MPRRNPGIDIVAGALYDLPRPRGIGYFWTFGSALGVFYIIQLVTGICLSLFYFGGPAAFDTSLYIARDVNSGWLIRSVHANGARFFLGFIYLHLARGLYFSSFRRLSRVWLRGRIILVGVMAAAFLGYVLPWGQMRYWGATVITNLVGVVPVVGGPLVELLWGGYTVRPSTLTRFYRLHYIVPLALSPVVLAHLELLHVGGRSNPLGGSMPLGALPFYPYAMSMDIVTFWFGIGLFSVAVLGFPHALGSPDNFEQANPLKTPVHIMPEWYFLPFYTILRSIPQKTLGVLAMAAAIALVFILPGMAAQGHGEIGKLLIWALWLNFVVLGWLGACPMEAPFPYLGAVNSAIYFRVVSYVWVGQPTHN